MHLSDYTIPEIKDMLKEREVTDDIIKNLQSDSRKGVQKLAKKYIKKKKEKEIKQKKWTKMNSIAGELRYKGYQLICGLDEAGRGPLAGPVAAAAVILNPEIKIIGLDDSKKLSKSKREELYEKIKEKAIAAKTAMVGNKKIDEINIQQASFLAMKKAIDKLDFYPDYLLVDGNRKITDIKIPQKTVIDGDGKVNSIAAASILAKVTRDNILEEYDEKYPEYGFAQNKGYGTKQHIKALEKYGPSPIHRYSYSVVEKNA